VIALDLPEKGMLSGVNVISVYYSKVILIGPASAAMIVVVRRRKNLCIGKGFFRGLQLTGFVTGRFTTSTADASRQINEHPKTLRVFVYLMGSALFQRHK
jgi:hypothetical protein